MANEMDLTNAGGWRPEEGDTLVGHVTDIASGFSDWSNDYYPIVTVQPEVGGEPVAIHCFHKVLASKMLALQPQVGDRIGVKYVGKKPSKDGKRTVTEYVVRRDGGPSGNPWAAFAQAPRPVVASIEPPAAQESTDDIPF